MKGRKRRMNGLQKEIENRHLPELMRLENGDAVTNCAVRGLEASPGRN